MGSDRARAASWQDKKETAEKWLGLTPSKMKLPEAVNNLKSRTSVKPHRNALWRKGGANGYEALKGTLIHAELADLMRGQNMSNVGVEVSYNSVGDVVTYGTKGSIRVDYEVYAGGNVVQVFDLKPSDFINPNWLEKASRYIRLSPDEIKAISYEAYR